MNETSLIIIGTSGNTFPNMGQNLNKNYFWHHYGFYFKKIIIGNLHINQSYILYLN